MPQPDEADSDYEQACGAREDLSDDLFSDNEGSFEDGHDSDWPPSTHKVLTDLFILPLGVLSAFAGVNSAPTAAHCVRNLH